MAGHAVKYPRGSGPLPMPHVAMHHRVLSKTLGGMMWFWILYNAKKDYQVWFGWKQPFENH